MKSFYLIILWVVVACSSSEEDQIPQAPPTPPNNYSKTRIHSNLTNGNLALKGYDPVAYLEYKVLEGDPTINATHDDILYYFTSVKNKETFEAEPEKFIPQYGGWCATGMAFNLVDPNYPPGKYIVDPKKIKIEDGKLYLFYNRPDYRSALSDWNRLGDVIKKEADQNWASLTQ